MKTKSLIITATASLIVLLTALFVPLFCGIAFVFFITLSVWEYSHLLALLCIAAIAAFTLVPVVRPSRDTWLFPLLLGSVVFVSALCAVPHLISVGRDDSNILFHPIGLLLLALGGLLCIVEGFLARSQSRRIPAA